MRDEPLVPGWIADALQRPVASSASRRAAIMARVRREPAPRVLAAPMRASRWSRRGLLTPFGGMAMVAMLTAVISLRGLEQRFGSAAIASETLVLGDSVVPARLHGARPDSVSERLLDTLRIVEFVLRGPSIHSAAVVGDFNAWQRGATSLARDANGDWHARVLVPRDVVRFAYVVNEAQVVAAPMLPPSVVAPPAVPIAARHSSPDSI